MNDYWHIPRASLAGSASSAASSASSSNRSNKSNSNPATVAKRAPTTHSRHPQHRNQPKMHLAVANNFPTINYGQQVAKAEDGEMVVGVVDARKPKRMSNSNTPTRTPPTTRTPTTIARRDSELNAAAAATTAAAAAAVLAAAAAAAPPNKRGSRSSQGSSDSNNSTRSAASGSLLLTAANLERFAEIHKKQHQLNKLCMDGMPSVHHHHQHNATTYNANLVQATSGGGQQQQSGNSSSAQENGNNNDATITMDPNLDFIKTKDLDTVSIASSMHFTMVNGEIGQTKKPKRGLCDRGRQVTVLIVSMSTIFLLLIMGMVYALEMRAREMPQS